MTQFNNSFYSCQPAGGLTGALRFMVNGLPSSLRLRSTLSCLRLRNSKKLPPPNRPEPSFASLERPEVMEDGKADEEDVEVGEWKHLGYGSRVMRFAVLLLDLV